MYYEKQRQLLKKIQETLYIRQWCFSPLQNRYLGISHSSPSISSSTVQNTLRNPLLWLPSASLSYFPESHWQSEISSLSKVILVLGKAVSRRAPNLCCRGLSHLGDLVFCQKTLHKTWYMSRWAGTLLWWSCQSPVTYSYSLLNHLNSFCGGMFKLNAKFDTDSLFYSLSHLECNGHTVHMLTEHCLSRHWLVQWSCHC